MKCTASAFITHLIFFTCSIRASTAQWALGMKMLDYGYTIMIHGNPT